MTFKVSKFGSLKGAGDAVALVAEPIKKALVNALPSDLGKVIANCNCEKRKEFLNKLIPFSQAK